MVPLPLHAQLRPGEGVVRRQVGTRITGTNIWLLVPHAILRHVSAIVANDRPSIDPLHRLQVWNTTNGTSILEEHGPPLAGLGFHQGSLMNRLTIHQQFGALLVGAHRIGGTEDGLRTAPIVCDAAIVVVVGAVEVVVVANMVHVGAFQSIVRLRDDRLFCNLLESLRIQLDDRNVVNATSHIETAISVLSVVEEPSRVMVASLQSGVLPFAFRIRGSQKYTLSVLRPCGTGEVEVELAVVITERRCPHALGIMVLAIHQVIGIVVKNLLQGIGAVFPVHQVFRLQDSGSRHVIHRCADHVISVVHTNHVNVGEVAIDYRVDKLPVALVSRPCTAVRLGGIVLLGILLIPLEAGTTAGLIHIQSISLHRSLEGWHHLTIIDVGIDVDKVVRMGQGHGHVAIVVEHGFEELAPLRRGTRGPCAIVLIDRLVKLVVMVYCTTCVLGTPVHLRHHNGVVFHHRHCIAKVLDALLRVVVVVTHAIPARIDMDGIADVIPFDGIGGIVAVVALIARAGNQDDARIAVGTNLVNDRLEEVVQCLGRG